MENKWIIYVNNNAVDGIDVKVFEGSEVEVNEVIEKLVEECIAGDEEHFEHTEGYEKREDSIMKTVQFHDYHIEVGAYKVDMLEKITI